MIELAGGTELAGARLDVEGAISHTLTLRVIIRCCHLYQSLHVNMDSSNSCFYDMRQGRGATASAAKNKLWLFTRYVIACRVNV
jgi:hypothetical protein